MGKGEHDLCESFLVYHTYMDRADKAIRTHGDVSFSQGGSFYDAIYCLKNYGIVPQDAMPAPGTPYGDSLFNFNQLSNVTTAYVEAIAKSNAKKINPVWKKDLNCMYENYFGKLPEKFTYKGKEYTPQSYAKSLGLNPDDYVSLTSFHGKLAGKTIRSTANSSSKFKTTGVGLKATTSRSTNSWK